MTRSKYARLIAPASTLAVGTAAAIAVRIGHTWTDAIVFEVFILVLSTGWFLLTLTKSDVGAIYGQRQDERQQHVVLRASRFAMIVLFAVTYLTLLIQVASNKVYWQEDVILSVGGVSYFLGLLMYGSHNEDDQGTRRGIMASDADGANNVIPPM